MTDPTPTLSPMTTQILNVVLPILATFLTGLAAIATAAVKRYFDKLGGQVDAQQFYQRRAVAESAVLLAEEEIEHQAKTTGLEGRIDKGAAKLDRAVETIQAQLPDVSADRATELAKEAVARYPGLGASGDVSAARS
jgi:hypothetical protein